MTKVMSSPIAWPAVPRGPSCARYAQTRVRRPGVQACAMPQAMERSVARAYDTARVYAQKTIVVNLCRFESTYMTGAVRL